MLHLHVSTVAQDGQTKVWLKNTWPVHVFRAFSSHHEARSIQLVAGPLNYWESGSFLLLLQYCCIVVQYPDEDCLIKTLEIQIKCFLYHAYKCATIFLHSCTFVMVSTSPILVYVPLIFRGIKITLKHNTSRIIWYKHPGCTASSLFYKSDQEMTLVFNRCCEPADCCCADCRESGSLYWLSLAANQS